MEDGGHPLESSRIQWNPVKILGILSNPKESSDPWNPIESNEIQWKSLESGRIQWNPMEIHGNIGDIHGNAIETPFWKLPEAIFSTVNLL